MSTLKSDFPGFAALEEAGEATTAKVRDRIKAGTLKEIKGIGEATEADIIAAFDELDTPADNAEDLAAADNNGQSPSDSAEKLKERESQGGEGEGDTTINDGPKEPTAEPEADKSGAEKNVELANHDLGALSPAERAAAGVQQTDAERLANCGAVFVDAPEEPYASKTAVKIEGTRTKVLPIAHVSPRPGMTVKDGEDTYALPQDFNLGSQPIDWLRVRSPNTGRPFID